MGRGRELSLQIVTSLICSVSSRPLRPHRLACECLSSSRRILFADRMCFAKMTDQQSSAAATAAAAGFSTDPALLSKLGETTGRPIWPSPGLNETPLLGDFRTAQFLNSLEDPDGVAQLPAFIKPLPSRIAVEDARYLHTKGALTLPSTALQNALLQAYVEYVHPYMPLMELHEFLNIVNSREGYSGQVSLFLYQAVMFVATAFVGGKHLKDAGYSSRRAARRDFFHRTRVRNPSP